MREDISLVTPVDQKVESSELVFEPLSPANAEEAMELVDKIFAYEKGGAGIHILVKSGVVEVVAPEKTGKDYKEHYWVVRNGNGRAIGITGLNEVSGDKAEHCWLGWHGLVPEMRGKGLGAILLERVVAEARSLGKRELFIVSTDLPEMQGNRKFYEKNGCEIVETIDKSNSRVHKDAGLSREIVREIQKDHQGLFEEMPEMKVFIWKKDLKSSTEDAKKDSRTLEKTL